MRKLTTLSRLCTLAVIFTLMLACSLTPSSPRPPAGARPTRTPLPNLVNPASSATGAATGAAYAFHINFQLDEQVSCPGTGCDTAYISHMVLYLRGDVAVDANGSASGTGVMRFISVDACQTLLADISSCSVTGFTDGAFTIKGRLNGNDLEMTLHLTAMPVLSATMMTQMPSGSVSISLDGTYEEEIKQTLMNAGVFEKTLLVSPEISTNFEGEYVFGGGRTMHGFGGLLFISPDFPLP